MNRKVIFGAVGIGVLFLGGWLFLGGERDFVFDVKIEGIEEQRKTSILVNDVEVETFAGKGDYVRPVKGGRASRYRTSLVPQIRLRYWFPCGWQEIPLEVKSPSNEDVGEARRENRNIPLTASVLFEKRPDETHVSLRIDNRKQPARAVKVGDAEFSVPEKTHSEARFLVDYRCKEGSEVSIDGKVVATLPPDIPSDAVRRENDGNWTDSRKKLPSAEFLFDTTGTRCYLLSTVEYAAAHLRPMFEFNPNAFRGSSEELKSSYLHRIRHVDFYFVGAPSEVKSESPITSRTSLVDC
jgi:hypothetical protein